MTQTTTTSAPKYFDIHTTAVAYVNRGREVPVKRGPAFLAVDLSALRGPADDVEYTRFDCRVSGTEAQNVIRQNLNAINDPDKKVLIGAKIGDLYSETFVYEKGEKQGQTGVSLKAHLLRISWMKIDGKVVYTAPSNDAESASSPAADEPEMDKSASTEATA